MRTAKYYHHFFRRIIIRPAMAAMTINGSFPDATTSGTGRRAACGRGLLRRQQAKATNMNARRRRVSWSPVVLERPRSMGQRASSVTSLFAARHQTGTKAEGCLSLGQLRGNYLPALRPFLTNQSHANLIGLRPAASVDDAHEDACITKDPHICHTRSRPSKPAGPGAFWNDVPFVERTAIKTATTEIFRDD